MCVASIRQSSLSSLNYQIKPAIIFYILLIPENFTHYDYFLSAKFWFFSTRNCPDVSTCDHVWDLFLLFLYFSLSYLHSEYVFFTLPHSPSICIFTFYTSQAFDARNSLSDQRKSLSGTNTGLSGLTGMYFTLYSSVCLSTPDERRNFIDRAEEL